MLDEKVRPLIDPVLDALGRRLAGLGVTANQVTVTGFGLGIAAAVAIALAAYWTGLVLLLASRTCDGLDGAVARATAKSDFGGYLDIVLDFGFYGAIPFGFILADPGANALPGALLILSFYFNGASFLAYATIVEKRGMGAQASTKGSASKSFFFSVGLAEATETLAVFIAFCLLPRWFSPIAYVFAAITFYTAASRIVLAARTFRS